MGMLEQPTSYLSPKLISKAEPDKGGHGVIARTFIHAGELLVVWGGEVVSETQLVHFTQAQQRRSIQIEDNLYLIPGRIGPADYVNHSCEPNAGLSGQISLVAMRNIEPGEEVCFDYAMSDGSPYDEFECNCNAPTCRGYITGNDWRNPDLWPKYEGYFSPYLQRRINRLKHHIAHNALPAIT